MKKINGAIKKIIVKLNIVNILSIPLYIFRIFPIKNNRILFENFTGKGYADSPKSIAENLINSNDDYELYWVIKDNKFKKEFPSKIKAIKLYSLKYFYIMATAKVWVSNSRFDQYVIKRKQQFYIQTWHGGLGMKKIEYDAEDKLSEYYKKVMKKDKERYLYALIICACVFISLGIYSYWRRREKEIKNQKKILEQTIEKQRQNNLRIKEENRQQIEKLQEQLIAMEKERQEGWEGQQLLQEKRVLEIHNESIDADEKRQSLRIAQMEDSDIYKKIHTEDCVKLTDDEWRALEKLLDQTFNNFTARLKESYPKISYKEIQVCYLTKMKLSSTRMTEILRYNSSPLRSRLYKKIFKEAGRVQDFNSFIAGF